MFAERKTSSMAKSSPKYRYNPEPRLSANQLAEYLKASPTRRKGIIKDAKFPRTLIVAQYKGAREGIGKFICSPERDQGILANAIIALTEREAKLDASDWTKDDSRRSIEAITTFHNSIQQLGINKLDCRPIVLGQPNLSIGGVEISVSLDATTHRLVSGEDRVGGIICLYSKASETSGTARADRCKVAAVLALRFATEHLGYMGNADPKLCWALDVMDGKPYRAPDSYKMLLDNMAVSCEEVALRWGTITPPADYDGPAIAPQG